MKTTIKHENDKLLVITLKHVSGLKADVNCLGTIKQWAIAHENGHKMRRLGVLGHFSPTSIESYGRCKSPGNSKTVGHENGHKTLKLRVFSHISQTCNGSYRPCKSAWNAKTVGSNS